MGHEVSKIGHHLHLPHLHHKHKHDHDEEPERDERIDTAFRKATGGEEHLKYSHIQNLFSDDICECIWPFLTGGKSTEEGLTIDEFAQNVLPLLENPIGSYIGIFQPVDKLIRVCAAASGASPTEADDEFIEKIKKDMTAKGDSMEALIEWKTEMCPNLTRALHELICNNFLGEELPAYHLESRILTPVQMWFLQACLPHGYFSHDLDADNTWNSLYCSAIDGMSVQRFESNIFGYRGYTVSLILLTDGRTVALASDSEWRDDTAEHGGTDTVFFELNPEIKKIPGANSIHCNFKIHSKESGGLWFKDVLRIDGDLSQVLEMEVWGCAGTTSLDALKEHKERQKRTVNQNQKVPLPGNWDDNPDKDILEMGGIHFSNERKNMDMEAKRRQELEQH